MIAVTCPGCDKELRVKDELVGMKVKCPSCGNLMVVPAEHADDAAVAPSSRSAPSRQRDERDDYDEPSRTMPRKQSGGSGLFWVLGIIGAILLVCGGIVSGVIYVMYRIGKAGIESVQEMAAVQEGISRTQKKLIGKWEQTDGTGKGTIYEFDNLGIYYTYAPTEPVPHARMLYYTVVEENGVDVKNQSGQATRWKLNFADDKLTATVGGEGGQTLHFKQYVGTLPGQPETGRVGLPTSKKAP